MTKTFCDRCKREVQPTQTGFEKNRTPVSLKEAGGWIGVSLQGPHQPRDLCRKCVKELERLILQALVKEIGLPRETPTP